MSVEINGRTSAYRVAEGEGGGRTVEKSGRIDTGACDCAREIPHLVERGALAKRDTKADCRDDDLEDDGSVAQISKDFRHSCSVPRC